MTDPSPPEVTVLVKRLDNRPGVSRSGASLPTYMTPHAAGADVAAALEADLTLAPGARTLVPTGLVLAVPPGYEVQVRPRSGLALRHGVVLPNSPGTIDADYRGELQVIVMNLGHEPFTIRPGDRIAQLVLAPVARARFAPADELPPTERGSGGFGHTGR